MAEKLIMPLTDEDFRVFRQTAEILKREPRIEYVAKWRIDRFVDNGVLTWVIARGAKHRAYFVTEKGFALLASNPVVEKKP